MTLLPADIYDFIHGLGDAVQFGRWESLLETPIKSLQTFGRIGSTVNLNSCIVKNETHELARAFAIKSSVFLEFHELIQPCHHERLIVQDNRRLTRSRGRRRLLFGRFVESKRR